MENKQLGTLERTCILMMLKIADVYFNGQNIYSDYGHWVVGLIRIGTADIGDKYISGEMIYRRSNGIYAMHSVRFNLYKEIPNYKYKFAGVLYVVTDLILTKMLQDYAHLHIKVLNGEALLRSAASF